MKGLLKFITCGSVDDGKSTLIGHILYDSKLIYADQEKALDDMIRVAFFDGKIQAKREKSGRAYNKVKSDRILIPSNSMGIRCEGMIFDNVDGEKYRKIRRSSHL